MIFHPEWSNILNSSWTYHIINWWQNIPYKINDKTITTKETWDKIIQHIRKSQDAKIITVDITDIVKASNETTRKAKIEEIFWTWNTQESKEFLASIWAITWSEETINTTILTQTVESIITGWSVGSASSYTAPKTPATCWTANKTYENTANSFWTDTFIFLTSCFWNSKQETVFVDNNETTKIEESVNQTQDTKETVNIKTTQNTWENKIVPPNGIKLTDIENKLKSAEDISVILNHSSRNISLPLI